RHIYHPVTARFIGWNGQNTPSDASDILTDITSRMRPDAGRRVCRMDERPISRNKGKRQAD
ncbi:MAG: hypothetical protein RMJ33_01125, partial [Saprospiraceae bacterium]|nr:hypothetical protein [Saprospiraceae bacterium]